MKIALVQMSVVQSEKRDNLARALKMLEEAREQGADVAVLPETPFAGWLSENAAQLAETIPGPICSALSEKARETGMAIVSGITEDKKAVTYNSAVLFDGNGQLISTYSKVNGWARHYLGLETYAQGTSLGVCQLGPGLVALTICSDSWVPYLTETVARMGARVVLSPSAWASVPGEVDTNVASIKEYYRQRTTESQVYLVGVNSVGSMTEGFWKGRIVHGTSLVYGPGGRLLLEGPRGEEAVLLIDIPDEELVTRGVVAVDSTREEGSFPAEDTPRA